MAITHYNESLSSERRGKPWSAPQLFESNENRYNESALTDYQGAIAMLLNELRAKKDAILAAGRQYGARRIRVFGSVARGEEQPDSDIDFLVDLPPGYDMFAQRLPLTERLVEITGRRLDVVPEHELNRHLRDTVIKEAVDL